MGSQNLKVKKKIKFKNLKKFQRLKEIKRIKFSASDLSVEPKSVKTLSGIQDIFINRLCDQQIYSRYYVNDDDIPKVKRFTQVRKQYFSYLQTTIKNNCAYYGSPVAEEILDSLSLKLEQHALLSSLQLDIYENFLTKIISDIEKCTKERQIHTEVKKLLPDSEDNEAFTRNKFNANSPESEKCLETTISTSADNNLDENEIILTDQSISNTEILDKYPSYSQRYSEPCTVPQHSDQLSSLSDISTDDDYDAVSEDNSSFTRKEHEAFQSNEVEISQASTSIGEVSSPLQNENDPSNKNEDLNYIPLSSQFFVKKETSDTLSEYSNIIEEQMEQIFSQDEISDKPLEENDERAYISQTLEGENVLNDRAHDGHSEYGAEYAENDQEENKRRNEDEREREAQLESETEKNLAKRLEKMKALFNIDEKRPKRKVYTMLKIPKKSKPKKKNKAGRQRKRLTAWKNEKIIQLYKVSILASQMSYEKREGMRKLFSELFGEDSDEENEFEYGSTDRFRTSCTERISSWVVKHLMPFYHKRRIIGRRVFKSLGRRISQTIIDKIQYPDERTVKYFVHKFFPPNKRYGWKSKLHHLA